MKMDDKLQNAFIRGSEKIANYFQVPTKVTIDENGIVIEIGGIPDTYAKRICTESNRVDGQKCLSDHIGIGNGILPERR
ncbi:MAG TPA: hypothetical protein VGG71_12510 [Chitinophagaceae bacterium]